ncbi:MAG: alpha/beta fold hydrolase [Flavobacteriaceae bacterium]
MKLFFKSLLILVAVGCLFFYFFQELLLFRPGKKLSKDAVYSFPEDFEEVNLITADHETINALHFTLENPKGIVLFFHGNRGNLNRWGTFAPTFLQHGYEVFMMDYRGYGKSTGSFHEEKMYSDALLAYEHVRKTYQEQQIIVYGYSLGSTFAARIGATQHPKHVIFESPFYTMKKAVRHKFALSPVFLMRYHFPTYQEVPKISAPMTIFHGTKDPTTSFEESQALFNLLEVEKKQFVTLEGGDHHNVPTFKEYQEVLKGILE